MRADLDEYEFLPLIRRQEFIEPCISLLNQEWPRSYSARENSLKRSLSEVPNISLVLLAKSSQKLIGHARICTLPNNTKACWVESVIIDQTLRGKGIGKLLMFFVEEKAKDLGFSEVYLSTEDKFEFYRKCGYEECAPLLNVGAASKLLSNSGFDKLLKPKSTQISLPLRMETPAISKSEAPPPPPLPISKSVKSIPKRYLSKKL